MVVGVLGRWMQVLMPITACIIQKGISDRRSDRSSTTTSERDGRYGGGLINMENEKVERKDSRGRLSTHLLCRSHRF